MKKLLPIFCLVLFTKMSFGQASTANYTRTSSAAASLITMTGSTQLIAANQDDVTSELFDIGFDFWFMGVRYTEFSASSNGAIRLGGTAISSSLYAGGFPAASQSIIAPFLQNMRTSTTGKVHYLVTGTAPNRVMTVEFLNMGMNRSSATADATFQLSLYEGTGVIQFTYGAMAIGSASGSATNQNAVIGFCNTNTANNVMSVTHAAPFTTNTTAIATTVTYSGTGNIAGLNSVSNGSRVQITFTPPVRLSPINLTFTLVTPSSMQLNWTDIVPNELGFVVYISDDGGLTYTFDSQTAINATNDAISPLLPAVTYYYKIYSVSEGALSTALVLTGSRATSACALSGTNSVTYTGASTNWSSLGWSLGHVPTQCEDAVLTVNRTAGSNGENVDINLDVDVACKSITINNISSSTTLKKYVRVLGTGQVTLSGDLKLTGPGGNKYNRCVFAPTIKTIVNGNVVMGSALPIATEGYTSIGSSSLTIPNEAYLLRGDLTFNKRSYITDEHAVFTFDRNGTQTIYNNIPTGTADTLQAVLFEKMIIGNAYSPTVVFAGTGGQDGYIESQSRGGIIMNPNTTLTLAGNYSLNCLGGSCYFKMGSGTKLKLGGDQSIIDPFTATQWGVAGSNFPGGFATWVLDPNSLIEYNGGSSITQTIYNGVTYANLDISNGTGSGRAAKITTGGVVTGGITNIKAIADVTLGSTWANTGAMNVISTGGLYCATNVVSGAGAFTLNTGGYLGMGHVQGITAGAFTTGNIQMLGGRSFNTGANYIYNGSAAQITGNGLPVTCNDLTIDNPTTVTIANSQTVTGINSLKQGVFDIGTNNKITITGTGTLTSTTGKMKANLGMLEMNGSSGTAQSIDGSWFVNRNISTLINSNTTGVTLASTANDTLLISSALLYGTGTTNSVITTNGNLTLLSRDTATARFGQIVTGSSNSISGNVNVERYIGNSARKWRHLAWPTTSSQTARQSWMENNSTANGNLTPGYGVIVTDATANWSTNNFDSRSLSGPSVKYYNPSTNNYSPIPNTTSYSMNSQSAYFNYVRGDRACTPANNTVNTTILRTTGTLKTGDQAFSVTAGKYAAIGNPYASAIDIRYVDTLNLTSTFQVWDPKLTGAYGLGAYQTLYASGGGYKVMPGGGSYGALNSAADTIESGQAFFVKARAGFTGTLTVKETAKQLSARTMQRDGGNDLRVMPGVYPLLSLTNPGGPELVDGCMANFDSTYSCDLDDWDILKMVNTSENVSFTRSGQLFSIERRKNIIHDDTLFINVTGYRVHQYQWDITVDKLDDDPTRTGFLVDKFLNTSTPLNLDGITTFMFNVDGSAGSNATNRFMIVFKQPAVVLPVRFTSISAVRNTDKTVTVKWKTENEINMQDYRVEHSNDGINFTEIGTQLPSTVNGGAAAYSLIDINATTGNNYYRVRGNSLNGQRQYTAVVKVGPIGKSSPAMSIYPNPVTDGTVNVRFENQPKGNYTVNITNKAGQLMHTETVQADNNNFVRSINLGVKTAPGGYQVTVTDESGKMVTIPFIIQ